MRDRRPAVRRITAWLLLPTLLLATLAGCTPPPDKRVAIRYLPDGTAEVLALVCSGDEVVQLSLFEDRTEGDSAGWTVEPSPRGEPRRAERTELLRVTLFDTPPGWERRESSLTRLSASVSYGLSFTNLDGRSVIGFTIEDLERLGDRVLTGRVGDNKVRSESEFIEAERASCES